MTPTRFALFRQIPTPIWVPGFVSSLMDISCAMVHSLLPMFLVSSLSASVEWTLELSNNDRWC